MPHAGLHAQGMSSLRLLFVLAMLLATVSGQWIIYQVPDPAPTVSVLFKPLFQVQPAVQIRRPVKQPRSPVAQFRPASCARRRLVFLQIVEPPLDLLWPLARGVHVSVPLPRLPLAFHELLQQQRVRRA
jgi:hypothetical protein